jgi:rhomboid protease GluP
VADSTNPPLKITATLLSQKPRIQGFWIAGILIFLCALFSLPAWRNQSVMDALIASRESVFQKHEGQRLFSALFVHGDMGHLLSNAYMLFFLSIFVFGNLALSIRGAFQLLGVLLIGGALANALTLLSYKPQVGLLGISGFVYLLAGYWFVNYLLIDRRRSFGARLVRVIGVCLVILFPTTFEPQVSYLCHLHGFWLGLVFGSLGFFMFKGKIRSFEVFATEESPDSEPLVQTDESMIFPE